MPRFTVHKITAEESKERGREKQWEVSKIEKTDDPEIELPEKYTRDELFKLLTDAKIVNRSIDELDFDYSDETVVVVRDGKVAEPLFELRVVKEGK